MPDISEGRNACVAHLDVFSRTSWAHALEIGETFRNNRTCLVIKKGNLSGFSIRSAVGSVPAFSIAIGSAAGDADKQTPFIILSKQSGGSDVGKSF